MRIKQFQIFFTHAFSCPICLNKLSFWDYEKFAYNNDKNFKGFKLYNLFDNNIKRKNFDYCTLESDICRFNFNDGSYINFNIDIDAKNKDHQYINDGNINCENVVSFIFAKCEEKCVYDMGQYSVCFINNEFFFIKLSEAVKIPGGSQSVVVECNGSEQDCKLQRYLSNKSNERRKFLIKNNLYIPTTCSLENKKELPLIRYDVDPIILYKKNKYNILK